MAAPASWERVLIINNAVQESIPSVSSSGFCSVNAFSSAEQRRMLRIRCMSWAALLDLNDATPLDENDTVDRMNHETDQQNGVHAVEVPFTAQEKRVAEAFLSEMSLKPDIQLLAVTSDCDSVSIVQVHSPHTYQSNSWGAKIVQKRPTPNLRSATATISNKHQQDDNLSGHLLETQETQFRAHYRPSLLAAGFQKRNFAEGVLWSPWRVNHSERAMEATVTTIRKYVATHTRFLVRFVKGNFTCRFADSVTKWRDLLEPVPGVLNWCQSV